MPELIKSRVLKVVLVTLASLVLLSGAFCLGVNIGERKASHFAGWFENYDRAFGHRPPGGAPQMPLEPAPFPGGHGVFGKVVSVSTSTVVIAGKDNIEQDVSITSSTAIRDGRGTGTVNDIKPDMDAAVFGAPNDHGQIDARLIRIFSQPQPPVAQPQPPTTTN